MAMALGLAGFAARSMPSSVTVQWPFVHGVAVGSTPPASMCMATRFAGPHRLWSESASRASSPSSSIISKASSTRNFGRPERAAAHGTHALSTCGARCNTTSRAVSLRGTQ